MPERVENRTLWNISTCGGIRALGNPTRDAIPARADDIETQYLGLIEGDNHKQRDISL